MSMDDSLYAAPGSALDRPVEGQARSLDAAMAGDWDFEIGEVLREAWDLVSGSKGPIWLGLLIVFAASFAVQFSSAMLVGTTGDPESPAALGLSFLASIAANMLSMVVSAGAYFYALKRAAGDESAAFGDILSAFGQFVPLAVIAFVMGALIVTGMFLLILPGIYLAIGYLLVWTLRLDRGLGIWEALETSRKTIHHHWFKVFGLFLAVGLLSLVGCVVTLGIGIIWAYPFLFLVMGVLHYKAFGYAGGA